MALRERRKVLEVLLRPSQVALPISSPTYCSSYLIRSQCTQSHSNRIPNASQSHLNLHPTSSHPNVLQRRQRQQQQQQQQRRESEKSNAELINELLLKEQALSM